MAANLPALSDEQLADVLAALSDRAQHISDAQAAVVAEQNRRALAAQQEPLSADATAVLSAAIAQPAATVPAV